MLVSEPDHKYIIMPSWVDGYCPWDEIPEAVAAGKKNLPGCFRRPHRFIQPGQDDWKQALPIVHAVFAPFPPGGGLFACNNLDLRRWESSRVLREMGNYIEPGDFLGNPGLKDFRGKVFYLEPYQHSPGMLLGVEKRLKIYRCGVTPEHCSAAGDRVYWVAMFNPSRIKKTFVDDLIAVAGAIGLKVTYLENPPSKVSEEADEWLSKGKTDWVKYWFEVEAKTDKLSLMLSKTSYAALHLKVSYRQLKWIHLVADIEHQPNFRKHWLYL